jgi:hypothetical protein
MKIAVRWRFTLTRPANRSQNATSGPKEKAVRRTAFAADGHRLVGAAPSLVSVRVALRRNVPYGRARIRTAACRCKGARWRAVMGSNTQALIKRLHARFVDSRLCKDRGGDRH